MTKESPEPIEVTVTFLAMAAPPVHPPTLPYNRQVALLRARNMPLHYYRYLLDRVGRKWHWVNALRTPGETLAAKIVDPERDIRVLYLDGVPAGFFDLRPNGPGEVELAYFGLMEHATGLGLGRWFLGAAVQAAWERKPERVVVQTCTLDHPAALPLYQKIGFSPVGQTKELVQPLTMDERSRIVMEA
jgi:GNAT superfamily N-acetyltransferase